MFSWLLCGCDKTSHDDSRLAEADSILRNDPDSALKLLIALDPDQLGNEADRAFYALLLTQARYKCYIAATSDSLINTALDYYTRHRGDQEKLTRTYIYKAAVMDELGQPKVAMTYYKDAQKTVAPDDYFNQGYIRLRIGQIYNDSYVSDSIDVSLFKEALHYFKLVPDSFYILASLCQIGRSYVKTDRDSVLPYLNQADQLAKRLHEKSLEQIILKSIADIKMYSSNHSDIDSAKTIVLSLLKNPERNLDDDNHLLMTAAYTLAKEGKTDSSYNYLRQVNSHQLAPEMQVFYNKCFAELAISKGDIKRYQYYFEKADNLSDSIVSNHLQHQLREVDARYDNEVLKNENLRKKTMISSLVLGSLVVVSLLIIALMFLSKKAARRKRELQESMDTIERLHDDTIQLTSRLSNHQSMNESLKRTIQHQFDIFTHLVEEHHKEFVNITTRFDKLLKEKYSANPPDSSFWNDLRSYVDYTCNGIIHQTVSSCPSLIESDVQFLTLYCCDLPTTVIMACMGYNDVHSVYNKKRRLSQMLVLEDKLDEYILSFKDNSKNKESASSL